MRYYKGGKFALGAVVLLNSRALGTPVDSHSRIRRAFENAGIPTSRNQVELTSVRNHVGYQRTNLHFAELGSYYAINIEVRGETYLVQIDTGSTDLWLPLDRGRCFTDATSPIKELPLENCTYTKYAPEGFKYGPANANMNATYGSGGLYVGDAGYEPVTVGGITVEKQQMAKTFINSNAKYISDWTGFLGMGNPNGSAIYEGTNSSADSYSRFTGAGHWQGSKNWFFNALDQGLIPHNSFSLLLKKYHQHGNESAGILTLGGAPDPSTVAYTGVVASAPVAEFPGILNPYWNFVPDGMTAGSDFLPWKNDNADFGGLQRVLIDSGAGLNRIPKYVFDAWAKTVTPPLVEKSGFWRVQCNATLGRLSIRLGGVDFDFSRDSLLLPGWDYPGCYTSLVPGGYFDGRGYLLGTPFMLSGVVTFDATPGHERIVLSKVKDT